MALELFTGPELLTDSVCSCDHAVRRHYNNGGCSATFSPNRRLTCPCALTKIECQFHVVRLSLHTAEKIVVKHKQHLREYLRAPVFVPSAVRWYVSPAKNSPMMVLFTTFIEAIEFATRDWVDPLGINTRVEL